jgi:adenine deaminase
MMRRAIPGLFWVLLTAAVYGQGYDVVIANGHVMDPASGLDAVRYVGIRDGKIAAISEAPLAGRTVVDASGLVVAPKQKSGDRSEEAE